MYALITDNKFVKWIDLARDFPNTSFPTTITRFDLPEGIVIVKEEKDPECERTQKIIVENAPVKEGRDWVLKKQVVDKSDDELAEDKAAQAQIIRDERNYKLREEIDSINPIRWESMTDSEKNALRAKRKALLDVPQQPGFPYNIQWP